MPLSWNEIRDRALRFSRKWAEETSEDAEAKSFLDDFFDVFGVSRRRVASFEKRIVNQAGRDGYIDLLWKGNLMVEMKSRGRNLNRAFQQALDYFPGLKEYELPKYILLSDFARMVMVDLETGQETAFPVSEFYLNVNLFGFIAGYQTRTYSEQDPVNIKAADLMGKIHDRLAEVGYEGHHLKVYLVRLLFLLFAEDTGIFEKQQFQEFIENKTAEDGSDVGAQLSQLFYVLNRPEEKRLKNLDEHFSAFRYVNGHLFEEYLPPASFDKAMRDTLLQCCALDWSRISPAIFGAMFQNVMDPETRHNLGAHYTSEGNILKVIEPLLLDELRAEFEKVKPDKEKLRAFHRKLATLKFLDPACGCGNFLIITYRELRLLEIEVIKTLQKGQYTTDVNNLINVSVGQFYGIEYEEFPARIAEVALWLTDHQMNMKVSVEFGAYFVRLPLKNGSQITIGNALQLNWEEIISKNQLSYILGNPPFLGSKRMSENQRKDLLQCFNGLKGAGILDYVSAWYARAAQYITQTEIKVAFVSTNSICQGEQVGLLWGFMFKHGIKIHFAHKSFKWANEAAGNAAVFCIIIGFAAWETQKKVLYDYEANKGFAHALAVKNINPYLVDGPDIIVLKREKPICDVPKMTFGNMPLDGGNLLFSNDEKIAFLNKNPEAEHFIRPLISGKELVDGGQRWCLWLHNENPQEYRKFPDILKRIEAVRQFRLSSIAPSTQKFASFPAQFRDTKNCNFRFLAIPEVSTQRRTYIPMAFFESNVIPNNLVKVIPKAKMYHFGILTSAMHMAWVSYICGRLGMGYRYSKDLVYNNFPWPEQNNPERKAEIERLAKLVLKIRARFIETGATLADLYDPLTMPPALTKAHQALDKAVDLAYRSQTFNSDANRMEFLFELYEKYTAGLFAGEKKKRKKKTAK